MTLPKGHNITVNGKSYRWLIKALSEDRFGLGWTPPSLLLTVQSSTGELQQFDCSSRSWTSDHTTYYFDGPGRSNWAPAHKVTFGPAQVREVIEAGSNCVSCMLPDWEVLRAGEEKRLKAALGPGFKDRVVELRAGGMNDSFIARQVVDDHYRATQKSLHVVQFLVERMVAQVPQVRYQDEAQ